MSKGGTRAREMMSGGVKVGLLAGRIGARRGAMQQMCRENHGWARISVSAELQLVGSRESGFELRHQRGTGRYRNFLYPHRSGLREASNAMISRNRTFVTVYLAGACEKRPHTVLSLIPSLQGLEPNVLVRITCN